MFRRLFSTVRSSGPKFGSAAAPVHEERHAVLPYRGMLAFWGFWAAFITQHYYFTRADESGQRRLHPITRWILWNRRTEREKQELFERLLLEGSQDAEVNVFYTTEMQRPVKDPRFDPRILVQKDWANPPMAQDVDYVNLEGLTWRKGYGEDEDAVDRLVQKREQQQQQ